MSTKYGFFMGNKNLIDVFVLLYGKCEFISKHWNSIFYVRFDRWPLSSDQFSYSNAWQTKCLLLSVTKETHSSAKLNFAYLDKF